MIYLDSFTFPVDDQEADFCMGVKHQCYTSFYPFKVLSSRRFERIDFEPITILYGGNGTGKSTALNVIAQKLSLKRESRRSTKPVFITTMWLCAGRSFGKRFRAAAAL